MDLEYEPEAAPNRAADGLDSSTDMKSQVKLRFDNKEEAIAYASATGFPIASKSRSRRRARSFPTPTTSSIIASCLGRTDRL